MPRNESTGGENLRPDRSTASENTTADDKNPGDWRPDREVVADIRRQLLDGDSARALAEQYPVEKDAILSLAKHGRGTGAIGPLRPLSTTGRWVPADTLVADGGVPDHVERVDGLGDQPGWYYCDECGETGDTPEDIGHHERCPGEHRAIADGGELECPECGHAPLDTEDDNQALADDEEFDYFCAVCGELFEDESDLHDGGNSSGHASAVNDLLTYKQHQYLPVRMDDPVFECVFVGDLDDLHHERKTYDYPAGRLARVPLVAQLAEGDAQ